MNWPLLSNCSFFKWNKPSPIFCESPVIMPTGYKNGLRCVSYRGKAYFLAIIYKTSVFALFPFDSAQNVQAAALILNYGGANEKIVHSPDELESLLNTPIDNSDLRLTGFVEFEGGRRVYPQ